MKSILTGLIFFCLLTKSTQAQVAINTDGSTADSSSILDVRSSSKGLLIPRLTTSQRKAIIFPATGLTVYDTSTSSFWFYDKVWKELLSENTSDNQLVTQHNSLKSYIINQRWTSDSAGYLYDSGGPDGNYGNNENNTFWIKSPSGSLGCTVEIISLNSELPYDSLRISYYTANNSFTSYTYYGNQSNLVLNISIGDRDTIQVNFTSNNVNTGAGFKIKWTYSFLPNSSTTAASAKMTGFYYIPEKAAILGGINQENNWYQDSIGMNSFGFGYGTRAKGRYSVSLGYKNRATGDASAALGYRTTAGGDYSIATGLGTVASGYNSTAFGYSTIASGFLSTSFGNSTTSTGYSSTAFGSNTSALGTNSTALGFATIANGYSSTVVGLYNDSILTSTQTAISNTTPLFIVGNGTYNARSNALVVRKDGNVEVENLQVGGGTVISKQQTGTSAIGTNGTQLKTITISFPQPFATIPKFVGTVRNAANNNSNEVYVVQPEI